MQSCHHRTALFATCCNHLTARWKMHIDSNIANSNDDDLLQQTSYRCLGINGEPKDSTIAGLLTLSMWLVLIPVAKIHLSTRRRYLKGDRSYNYKLHRNEATSQERVASSL